jgi:pyruvate/2-oxoglutarate dehydrogenase complex dihydrolipoamide dehydrogenase (E3) component
VPRRLVVLGGGPIGCELAQSFARLGSQVTQVEMAPRIMMREDEEVSALAKASLEADGVAVLTGHKALRCERVGARRCWWSNTAAPKSASPSTSCCAPWAAARA